MMCGLRQSLGEVGSLDMGFWEELRRKLSRSWTCSCTEGDLEDRLWVCTDRLKVSEFGMVQVLTDKRSDLVLPRADRKQNFKSLLKQFTCNFNHHALPPHTL